MKKQLNISYHDIICVENLFAAWQEFVVGKKKKKDVQAYGLSLADNIMRLHESLKNLSFTHGSYQGFKISDPKPRDIHKAQVRDRVLHHAIYRQLYPFFDRMFIADSYSCRLDKGVHKAIDRFCSLGRTVGKNHTRTVWILKCDIRKFFASIDHDILLNVCSKYIIDQNILWLLREIVESFNPETGIGLPLGNLTSQLFCNIYMNEFDQFARHKLKARYYIRYADDFIFLSHDKTKLQSLIPKICIFLKKCLKLRLHPEKVFIKTLASGVDFLGWTHFPHHRVLRTATRKRVFRGIKMRPKNPTLQSYLGLIRHGNTFKLKQQVLNWYGLWANAVR